MTTYNMILKGSKTKNTALNIIWEQDKLKHKSVGVNKSMWFCLEKRLMRNGNRFQPKYSLHLPVKKLQLWGIVLQKIFECDRDFENNRIKKGG